MKTGCYRPTLPGSACKMSPGYFTLSPDQSESNCLRLFMGQNRRICGPVIHFQAIVIITFYKAAHVCLPDAKYRHTSTSGIQIRTRLTGHTGARDTFISLFITLDPKAVLRKKERSSEELENITKTTKTTQRHSLSSRQQQQWQPHTNRSEYHSAQAWVRRTVLQTNTHN